MHTAYGETLTQMTVQLANVISDISGVTGIAIPRAIIDSERDPKLGSRKNHLIRAPREQIAQSLARRRNCYLCSNEASKFTICTSARSRNVAKRIETHLKT